MKTKLTKKVTVGITLIFAALIVVIISTGKAVADKPIKFKAKRKHKIIKTVARKALYNHETAAPKALTNESSAMKSILASTTGLKPHVLQLGLNAYNWAEKHGDVKKKYLTIVDFSIPSKYKRMWVINLNTDKVAMKTLVANGRNSGLFKGTRFSNRPGSLQSSLGVYVTGVHYYGNVGLSLHVHGLQAGINSNAYSREIEMHGAWYVSPSFVAKYGRVGRSWGCFALDKAVLPTVVKTIQNGSVIFAYANGFNQDYAPYAQS